MEVGEILLKRGLLDQRQLDQARHGKADGARLDQAAVEMGFITEEAALQALGDEFGLPYVDPAEMEINPSILKDFPQRFIHRESLFPVHQVNGVLVVANLYPLDEIEVATGQTVVPVLATRAEIEKLVKTHLGVGSETVEGLLAQTAEDQVELLGAIETDGSELSEMAQEPSVIRLVNEILLEALDSRASDVHVESQASGLRIRYRIDGVLHPQPVPGEISRFRAAIVSRLKIMARMNIAERRLPQDGRIQLKVAGREVDVRVSVIPMIHGEGLVLRLLDKGAMEFSLAKLGLSPATYEVYSELIELPHGIILAVGPTGCGKTTTLYASLIQIRSPDTKIITTEDPVEYQLEGINQIQIHPKIGLDFSRSLRSILRHDPDIVLLGEVRDLDTAEHAIQASLTGHMVFSTLHTNDAAGAYTRLTDMRVEPFLVASTLEAVMAQRLVRRICLECREPYRPDLKELPKDFPVDQLAEGKIIYRAIGCRACRQVGYTGRIGIYELLITTQEIRQLAHNRANTWEIFQQALKQGMTTMRQDGWLKVLDGVTSIDEIIRVTKENPH
ncbi:MAG: GspE/PulE family protein [Planctomycetota bacterium]|jgi:general secretion pathway protein E/type IV pilus assembly protein PilB